MSMGEYTENRAITAAEIDYNELDIEESNDKEKLLCSKVLLENAKHFRGFDQAMISFLLDHGYVGEESDIKALTKFVRTRFEEAEIPPLHNFKDLFNPNKGNKRDTAFKICFALKLDVEETNDFFKRVMFEKGIDCHSIDEAIYYFCLKNGMSYTEAQDIIKEIPKIKGGKKLPEVDILYTDKIIEYIECNFEKEKLIQYIIDNLDSFEYNNATAIKFIQFFWNKIIGADGLAVKEGRLIARMNGMYHEIAGKMPTKDMAIKDEVDYEKRIKKDDFVISKEEASTWTVYCQIMGLDNQQEMVYAANNRSLAPVFTDNVLLPLKASYCFPSQQTIDGIIRGESDGDYEKFRKMLIFLAFYSFWAKITINESNIFYSATYQDGDRCKEGINKYLVDAGYPELYAGNPYDWIFLWSMNDEHPLEAFRAYMREVYIAKSKAEE